MTAGKIPGDGAISIGALLLDQARRAPAAKALTAFTTADPAGPTRTWTRAELAGDVIGVAGALARAGIGPADRLALLLPTIPEYHLMLWGGATVASVLPLNPLLRLDHIEYLLRASGTSALAFPAESLDAKLWATAKEVFRRFPKLKPIGIGPGSEFSEIVAAHASLEVPPRRSSAAPAIVFHTGGTTGRPKLAVLTLANIVAAVTMLGPALEFSPFDTVVSSFPLFHVAGAMVLGLAPLLAGAHLVMPAPPGLRDQEVVQNFWRLLEKVNATVLSGVPTALAALSQVPLDADLRALNFVLTGAAPLPTETARRFTSMTGKQVHMGYGMTETAGVIAYAPRRLDASPTSVGPPPPNLEIRIQSLSPTRLDPAAGLVMVRGPNVFQRYLGEEISPLDEDGWLDTGDLGFFDDKGWLTLTGRSKDLIIRGGHNIDPAVIEEAASAHAAVSLSAAVGGIDPYAGEVPVLFVELKPQANAETTLRELQALLAETISEPPARPREIYMIERLPLTAVGKVFKPALRVEAARYRLEPILENRRAASNDIRLELDVSPSGRLTVDLRTSGLSDEAAMEVCREILTFDVALNWNGISMNEGKSVKEDWATESQRN